MDDVKNKSAKKLEYMLKLTVQEVADEVGKSRGDIYATYRKKNLNFYRIMLLGIRVLRSNLTTKEFLRMLEDAEALKGSN